VRPAERLRSPSNNSSCIDLREQDEKIVKPARSGGCNLGVSYGPESDLYSFPNGHPLNNNRTKLFASALSEISKANPQNIRIIESVISNDEEVLRFHTKQYLDFVKQSSIRGSGFLDYGDTPSFKGVYEAALFTVGNSLNGLQMILEGKVHHFFNPVGGLHHARRDRAGGFCVFNDCAVAISTALNSLQMKRVAYVDIDAHHGDGVYYGFEDDPRVFIGDIHEDGRYLYPGSGSSNETGSGAAKGTKLNIPLAPGSGDEAFMNAFDKVLKFIAESKPEFIFLQCGADGLEKDPLTHLKYSPKVHAYAASKLHELAHEVCGGKLLAMGGGGYDAQNVRDAWIAVVREMSVAEHEMASV